jgi:hypothetical protein
MGNSEILRRDVAAATGTTQAGSLDPAPYGRL